MGRFNMKKKIISIINWIKNSYNKLTLIEKIMILSAAASYITAVITGNEWFIVIFGLIGMCLLALIREKTNRIIAVQMEEEQIEKEKEEQRMKETINECCDTLSYLKSESTKDLLNKIEECTEGIKKSLNL